MSNLIAGTEVQARGLRWQVVGVEPQLGMTLVRLRGLGGTVSGQEIELLDGLDEVTPIRHEIDPKRAGRVQDWRLYHEAFVLEQALGARALLAVQPGRLDIQPYQLVPVVRCLAMSRVRMLLSDGVGLGKTIEAGLVITELMARRLVQRVLIVSPAGPLLDQWHTEMRERFGLRLQVADRARIEEVRRQSELGANPFDHLPLALTSVDFVKQERVLAELERSSYDIVVIDEAHHCVDPGTGGIRDDSLRRRAAEVLAARCDAILLLTATPHDGSDRSLASLCELLDPSLVDGHGLLRGENYRNHIVRRLKRHIRDPKTGKGMFPERQVLPCRVVADPLQHAAFVEMTRGLLALIAPELRRAIREKRYSEVLSFFALLKRSVSCAAACRATLQVVADRFEKALAEQAESQEARKERIKTLRDARRRLDRFGVGTAEEEAEIQDLEAEDIAQQLADLEKTVRSTGRQAVRDRSIHDSLVNLVKLASAAEAHDPKITQLLAEIATIRRDEPHASILVYTEYTTSQQVIATALRDVGCDVLTLKGADSETVRIETTERFRSNDNLIMVCTDAAAEGLNLHQRCHHLIHLELPFNPNRLEQRNGRIDRYGQQHTPVVRYLYLAGTFEQNILLRLIAKYERQRKRLTFVPNTLGITTTLDNTSERLLRGIVDTESSLFAHEPATFTPFDGDPADGADSAVKDLLDEIDKSFSTFEKTALSNAWLGDAGAFADETATAQANEAKSEGDRFAQVDLARFFADAVMREGGNIVKGKLHDRSFELRLPGAWGVDLSEFPGTDPDSRVIRLTAHKDVTRDDKQRTVGFLARAHPLVRHAIDRVRHTSLGDSQAGNIDSRASAVAGDVESPTLICTFLARIMSAAGREFERVVSVKLSRDGVTDFAMEAGRWLGLAESDNAISAKGIWEKHFAAWAGQHASRSEQIAADRFKPIGERFIEESQKALSKEKAELDRWLAERADDLTPAGKTQPADLPGLFDSTPVTAAPRPTTPKARLEAIRADGAQSAALRSKADAALKIHQSRVAQLDARLQLGLPEIVPLGILMVVPRNLTELRHGG